jgi:hypothetical protein
MEEIPMGEEVLAGMFFLNEHPVIILFDCRASHDFISSSCAKKAMMSTVTVEALYVISTPRGRVDADRIVHKAPLELARSVQYRPHYTEGSRDRWHIRDELDEAA